jgi:hypothetical protein
MALALVEVDGDGDDADIGKGKFLRELLYAIAATPPTMPAN